MTHEQPTSEVNECAQLRCDAIHLPIGAVHEKVVVNVDVDELLSVWVQCCSAETWVCRSNPPVLLKPLRSKLHESCPRTHNGGGRP